MTDRRIEHIKKVKHNKKEQVGGTDKQKEKRYFPLIEEIKNCSIVEIAHRIATNYKSDWDVYETKRCVLAALTNGVSMQEVIKLLERSQDIKQFQRHINHKTEKDNVIKRKKLPQEERDLIKKIFNLDESEIKKLDCAKPNATVREKIYQQIANKEKEIREEYPALKLSFDEALSVLCAYLGLDGYAPQQIGPEEKEAMMELLRAIERVHAAPIFNP